MNTAEAITLLLVVLAVRFWLAYLVDQWANRKGYGGPWMLFGFIFLIPTTLVLLCLPRKQPIVKLNVRKA
jgi:hypothetical protein